MLTYVVDKKSRLETIFAVLAASVVLPFSFIAWFFGVVLALLYAMGVRLPASSALGAAIISFAASIFLTLYIMSLMFLLWYLCRRSVRRRGHHRDRCRTTFNHQSQYSNPTIRLTNFAADFDMLANLDSLMPQLCKRDLIHTYELEELLRCKLMYSRSYQMLHLLTLLEKRGRAGLVGVVQALKEDQEHIGHAELADKLIKAHGALLSNDPNPIPKQNHGQFYV